MRNNEERFGAVPEIQDATPPQQFIGQNGEQNLGLSFVVPTEFVNLPSKGKFYPPTHPLHKKDVIEIKQMTAKEEDILTSKSLLKKGVALDKLIESLIVDKNIKQNSLTVEDRNAIIISARIAAYGADYTTTVSCPSCSQKSKYTFNLLEELTPDEVEETEEATHVDENGCFTIILPATKWKVVCRALVGNDEKTIVNLSEMKKKSANDSMLLEQLKLTVISIQGVTERVTVENALSAMPAKDSKYLRMKYQEVVKSKDLVRKFSCNSCDYEADLEVPLSADFFWFK